MSKRNHGKITPAAKPGNAKGGDSTLLGSAYSYYGGVVRTSGRPSTAGGVRRLFAAALLSGASMMAVGLAGTGQARAGTCLPQAGEGEQILCIGTFDETISIDVEDVTVVLGEGAIVDTTGNESSYNGDNIGIIVDGYGDQTVINDGTVLTGEEYSYEEYDGGHHGIVAYAEEGYDARAVNSETGIIGTTSEDSHGVVARSEWGDEWEGTATAINDGSVSTTGEGSFGVYADGKYADVSNTGLVFTEGSGAHGIYAYSKYESYAYNSGEIETEGSEADGIRAVTDEEYNEGDVEIVNAEGGIVRTSGEDSDGIYGRGEEVDVTNAGSVVTYGEYASGVSIEGDTVSLDNSGSIKTYGYNSTAVEADSEGPDTTTIVNTGLIAAYGENSDAIEASGPTVRITNDVVVEDEEIVAYGTIYAEEGYAIEVDETDDARVYNYGVIRGSIELSTDDYAYVRNDGQISSEESGNPVIEAFAEEGDAVIIIGEDGSVSTREDGTTAVHAGGDTAIVRNYGSVTTGYSYAGHYYGDYSAGIRARGEEEGSLALSTGSVTTFGDYAEALSASTEYGIAQALNTGDIDTWGTASVGVIAMDYNTYEEYSEYSGAIAGNAGDVATRGQSAGGVGAFSVENSAFAYNVLGGSISTSGDGAHGLAASTGFDSVQDAATVSDGNGNGETAWAVNGTPSGYLGEFIGDIGEYEEGRFASVFEYVDTEYFEPSDYRSTIVTTGDNALGVAAISSGGSAWAANFYGSITTGTFDEYDDPDTGEGSHGLVAYSETDDAIAMNKYYGHIVTKGHGAYGIWATSDDDFAFAGNKYASTVVTYGEGSTGIRVVSSGEYGAYGEGYDAGAYNIASSVTTHGDGATGISVISYEGDVRVVNANGESYSEYDVELPEATITTYGDGSDGVEAHAEYGTVEVYSDGTISTSGDDSHGIDVSGQTVEVVNYGNIYTSGEYSHGIVASSEGILTTTVVNGGLIQATGEDASAIRAYGPTVNVTNLEDGEIYAYDADAIYVGYAETVTVENSGTITSYGADGIDIQYAEYATVKNYGEINAVEAGIEITETEDVALYNYGSIEGRVDVSGAYDVYFLNDEDGEIIVSSENSDEDGGVFLEGFDRAELVNNGSISVYSDETVGVHLRGSTVELTNSGTISTTGEYSHAVVADSEGIATTTIYNSGTIEATGYYADAIRASGPTVEITNTLAGSISSDDGNAINAYDTKYVTILNYGSITGDVVVSASGFEEYYEGEVYVLNTGTVSGDIDTSGGESDDTIVIDGGKVYGGIYTGNDDDTVTVKGEGVQITEGIHAGESGEATLTFQHTDTITFSEGPDGYAVSWFDEVNFEDGTTVFDGVTLHTDEGEVTVSEGATLAASAEGAYAVADEVSISGTLDLALGGFFDVTGDVYFNEGSIFRTDISSAGAAVLYGNTITFSEGSTIDVDVTGGLSGVVGDDILIASAESEDGVTDYGATVEDNTILFDFLKVMNDEVIETGSADDLFLRVQLAETAEETEIGNSGRANLLSIAKAIDVYISTQPIDSPLTLWLAQFETEEEQRDALLQVIEDTMPSESNAEGSSTMASTDLIFDMIMDRISGGGFAIARNDAGGETGLAAGDEVLGGDGNWALWGRVGGLKAEYTPSGVNGYDTDMWGVTGGIDGEVAKDTRLGFSVFYTSADVDENGAGANASTTLDGYGAVAYMSYRPGVWYVNGSLGYGFNNYDSRRTSLGGVNVADYDGSQFVARTEVGRMFTSGAWDVTPNAGLRYNLVDVDAYTETGPLPTSIGARTIESVRAVGGVNFRYTAELESGSRLIPEFGVKVLTELADPDEAITGSVVGGGAFTTQTTPRDDVSFGVLGGLSFEGASGVTLRVTYDGEFQSDYDEQAVSASVRIAF